MSSTPSPETNNLIVNARGRRNPLVVARASTAAISGSDSVCATTCWWGQGESSISKAKNKPSTEVTFCLEKQQCHKTNNHKVPMVMLLICVHVPFTKAVPAWAWPKLQPPDGDGCRPHPEIHDMHDKASLKRLSLSVFA